MITKTTALADTQRAWHHIDASGKVLGRLSTEIALLLMGKAKPTFTRNLDGGDHVVVTNVSKLIITGNKKENKVYYRHSGYPGGFKQETFKELIQRKPEEVVIHAVKGMLPQNKLRDRMLTRLHIFAGENHTFQDKMQKKA